MEVKRGSASCFSNWHCFRPKECLVLWEYQLLRLGLKAFWLLTPLPLLPLPLPLALLLLLLLLPAATSAITSTINYYGIVTLLPLVLQLFLLFLLPPPLLLRGTIAIVIGSV